MGIHLLWQTLAKLAPRAFARDGLTLIAGSQVFLDVPVFAYAALHVLGTDKDAAANVLKMARRMLQAGAVTCTLVFDGTPHELKAEELAKRRNKSASSSPISNLSSVDQRQSPSMLTDMVITDLDESMAISSHVCWQGAQAMRSLRPTQATFDAIREEAAAALEDGEQVLCVQATADAEQTCAKLAKACNGIVCTSDSDTLTYGAPRVLRYTPGSSEFTLITLQTVLDELNLGFDAFQQWCVMCGSDFCEPIKNVGPITSLKFIRQAALGGPTTAPGELIERVFKTHGTTGSNDKKMVSESGCAFEERYKQALAVFTT